MVSTTYSPPQTRLTASQFQQLCQAASLAPSPDNNQPWAFRSGPPGIQVFHRRDRSLPSDVQDLFSWLAVGAAIENLVLSATTCGLSGQVSYQSRPFSVEDEHTEHVADIAFTAADNSADSLAEWIPHRCTNRKPYRRQPINSQILDRIKGAVNCPAAAVNFISDPQQIRSLSAQISVADRIRFEHRPFHDEFHAVLRYHGDESGLVAEGLDLKTLEVPPFAGLMFRALRPWRVMQCANVLGMSRIFAGVAGQQVRQSGAVGLLTTTDHSDQGFLDAGRTLQRVWLAATRENLAFHPLGALPLFLLKLSIEGPDSFDSRHAARLADARTKFEELFPHSRDAAAVMLFRIGEAAKPSARSQRYSLDQVTLNIPTA